MGFYLVSVSQPVFSECTRLHHKESFPLPLHLLTGSNESMNLKGLCPGLCSMFSNEPFDGVLEFHGSYSKLAFLWVKVSIVKALLHSLTNCPFKILLL